MTRPDIVWIYCDELRTDAPGCERTLRVGSGATTHGPDTRRLPGYGLLPTFPEGKCLR